MRGLDFDIWTGVSSSIYLLLVSGSYSRITVDEYARQGLAAVAQVCHDYRGIGDGV